MSISKRGKEGGKCSSSYQKLKDVTYYFLYGLYYVKYQKTQRRLKSKSIASRMRKLRGNANFSLTRFTNQMKDSLSLFLIYLLFIEG